MQVDQARHAGHALQVHGTFPRAITRLDALDAIAGDDDGLLGAHAEGAHVDHAAAVEQGLGGGGEGKEAGEEGEGSVVLVVAIMVSRVGLGLRFLSMMAARIKP